MHPVYPDPQKGGVKLKLPDRSVRELFQAVKKSIYAGYSERKIVRKKPIRGVFRLFNHKFCNFFESCKTCSACRKDFFDKLSSLTERSGIFFYFQKDHQRGKVGGTDA